MIFLNVGKYASPTDAIMETFQYDFQFASIVHLPRCAIVNSWMLYNLHQTESFLTADFVKILHQQKHYC